MNGKIKLPQVNENGYYEIRMESIGGLGANLCGKMAGELGALYLGLNASNFSSYGSEKRGSPVKAFVRWAEADREIQLNTPVESPHLLLLFHEAMAGKFPVTAGVTEKTKIVINSDAQPEDMRKRLRLPAGELYCIDALRIAMENKTRINMIMLGAMAKASGFIPLGAVLALAEGTVGKKYPELLSQNLEGIRRGYAETTMQFFPADGRYPALEYSQPKNAWGYENAPLGGVNPHFGSTAANDLSASREGYIPLFQPEKCIHCGLCDSTCPDMVFQFKSGEYKGRKAMLNTGLDYHHCKGCLRCVAVCPTNALVAGKEREHPDKVHFVRNKDLIVDQLNYEDAGPNSWVTSESHLTERRLDGGYV